jgi:hypothetical protein
MYFAFFYILFFALDILAATRLQVLGMIPVHYLVAGVGFFLSVFLVRRHHFWNSTGIKPIFLILFYSYVILISLLNFILASSRAFYSLGFIRITIFLPAIIITIITALMILFLLFKLPMKYVLSKWILFSMVAGFVRYSVESFISLPFILFRYSGVLDLIMLFGWLMIIVTLVRMEFAFEG